MTLPIGIIGNPGIIEADKLQLDYGLLFTNDEGIEVGFKVIFDTFIFTNKRLIIIDDEVLKGKQIEYLSIPYNKITKFSIEAAGRFDLDAELKIWIGSDLKPLERKFNKEVNIYDLHKVLATHVLK